MNHRGFSWGFKHRTGDLGMILISPWFDKSNIECHFTYFMMSKTVFGFHVWRAACLPSNCRAHDRNITNHDCWQWILSKSSPCLFSHKLSINLWKCVDFPTFSRILSHLFPIFSYKLPIFSPTSIRPVWWNQALGLCQLQLQGGEVILATLGRGELCEALEAVVLQMREHEVAEVRPPGINVGGVLLWIVTVSRK